MSRHIIDADSIQMQKLADAVTCLIREPRKPSPIIIAREVLA